MENCSPLKFSQMCVSKFHDGNNSSKIPLRLPAPSFLPPLSSLPLCQQEFIIHKAQPGQEQEQEKEQEQEQEQE